MPDMLSAETLRARLSSRIIGRRILHYPSVTSTNEEAHRLAEQGAVEGTVVVADEQRAGRGRLQRAWLSPPGSVALSVVLRPAASHLPYLIMVSSLAVARGIEAVTPLKPLIKWPNDVLIHERKICGILIENRLRGSQAAFSVIGIGVNVNMDMSRLPEVQATATSLSQECGREINRLALAAALLEAMERLYLSLPGNVFEHWRQRLATLGRRVAVSSGGARYEGVAEDVARDGSLLLRVEKDGTLKKIVAGDASLRA